MTAWGHGQRETFEHDGVRLLYHHVASGRPHSGSLKRVRTRPDGTLFSSTFRVSKDLKPATRYSAMPIGRKRSDDVGLWASSADGISAQSRVVGSSSVLAHDWSDLHLRFVLRLDAGARAGVVLRSAKAHSGELRSGDLARFRIATGFGSRSSTSTIRRLGAICPGHRERGSRTRDRLYYPACRTWPLL